MRRQQQDLNEPITLYSFSYSAGVVSHIGVHKRPVLCSIFISRQHLTESEPITNSASLIGGKKKVVRMGYLQ